MKVTSRLLTLYVLAYFALKALFPYARAYADFDEWIKEGKIDCAGLPIDRVSPMVCSFLDRVFLPLAQVDFRTTKRCLRFEKWHIPGPGPIPEWDSPLWKHFPYESAD